MRVISQSEFAGVVEIWRQLEQDRSTFVAEKPVTAVQARDAVFALRRQPLPVR
jgi:hypothetical protein